MIVCPQLPLVLVVVLVLDALGVVGVCDDDGLLPAAPTSNRSL